MDEVKQANFRIKQETADAFRKFCEENGMSQAQGFDHIMEVVALNDAKGSIPDRKTEIESFEMHAKALNEAYLRSLEIAEETQARVREEFKTLLAEKDKTITELQDKIADLKTTNDRMKKDREGIEKLAISSQREAAQARKEADAAQELSKEKEENSRLISEKLSRAEKELEKAEKRASDDAEIIKKQSAKVDALKSRIDEAERKLQDMENDTEKQMAVAAKEEELHEMKALEALRNSMNETIQTLREEKAGLQAQIDLLKNR